MASHKTAIYTMARVTKWPLFSNGHDTKWTWSQNGQKPKSWFTGVRTSSQVSVPVETGPHHQQQLELIGSWKRKMNLPRSDWFNMPGKFLNGHFITGHFVNGRFITEPPVRPNRTNCKIYDNTRRNLNKCWVILATENLLTTKVTCEFLVNSVLPLICC